MKHMEIIHTQRTLMQKYKNIKVNYIFGNKYINTSCLYVIGLHTQAYTHTFIYIIKDFRKSVARHRKKHHSRNLSKCQRNLVSCN